MVTIDMLRSSVRACQTFERPEDLVESVMGTPRPIEALVPKQSDQRLMNHSIGFIQCTVHVPARVRCSESAVFNRLSDNNISGSYFSKKEVLELLPGLIDRLSYLLKDNKKNFILLTNGTALLVWIPPKALSPSVSGFTWREALAQCTNGDSVFVRQK